jgi:hypothetical protein
MADQAQASGGYDEIATLHGSALHRRVTRLLDEVSLPAGFLLRHRRRPPVLMRNVRPNLRLDSEILH